jgi:hypothetical protein
MNNQSVETVSRAVVGKGQGRRGGGGPQLTHALGIKQERPYTIDQVLLVVPQNAIDIELCLRITSVSKDSF